MKIILLGAAGTIGKKVHEELSKRHEVITASQKNGSVKVDITSLESIQNMFKTIGAFDALVSCAGVGYSGPFETMKEEDFYKAIRSKMMGQVNLVMQGKNTIADKGSFTLITGILGDDPVKNSAASALVNGGINSFVKAAARELSRGIRINVVSPGLVEDSVARLSSHFPGYNAIPMDRVVNGFLKSVEGLVTGEVIRIY